VTALFQTNEIFKVAVLLRTGTWIDPKRAAFWKNRAVKRIQEIRAAQNQQMLGELLVGAAAVGVILALLSGSGGGSTDQEAESNSEKRFDEMNRVGFLAREADWLRRGGGMAGPPDGWYINGPIPGH
jgi:hypothetical protein